MTRRWLALILVTCGGGGRVEEGICDRLMKPAVFAKSSIWGSPPLDQLEPTRTGSGLIPA